MLANFIWSGRRPKIKNSTLIAAIEDGGLKLVDLHSKIKATYITWIQRCLKGSGPSFTMASLNLTFKT